MIQWDRLHVKAMKAQQEFFNWPRKSNWNEIRNREAAKLARVKEYCHARHLRTRLKLDVPVPRQYWHLTTEEQEMLVRMQDVANYENQMLHCR
jgi:hypothetical protein